MENETTPQGAEVAAPVDQTAKDQVDTATPESEEASRPKGVQKRIDELTRNWRQSERDRDHWRELAMRSAQPPTAPEPKVEAPNGKPTLEQCGFDQEVYLERLADYKLEQRDQKAREAEKQSKTQTRQQEVVTSLVKALQVGASKYEDFDIVRAEGLPFTPDFLETVVDVGDAAPDVLYYLAQNPDKATEIAGMSATRAAMALARIEAQLAPKSPVSAPPAAPQVSKAPPPPAAVGNRAPVAVDPMKLSADAWREQRNREIAARNHPSRK